MKDDRVFLLHILEEAEFIITESHGLVLDKLMTDEVRKRAFVRSLEIIGEASKNLSEEFRSRHSEIKWRDIAGLRDKLIHQYFGVNWQRVWDVIQNHIPDMKKQIEKILAVSEEH